MSANDPVRTSTPCTAARLGNPVGTSRLKLRIESELLADLTGIECGGAGVSTFPQHALRSDGTWIEPVVFEHHHKIRIVGAEANDRSWHFFGTSQSRCVR